MENERVGKKSFFKVTKSYRKLLRDGRFLKGQKDLKDYNGPKSYFENFGRLLRTKMSFGKARRSFSSSENLLDGLKSLKNQKDKIEDQAVF